MEHSITFIEGDGIGPEVWAVARPAIDRALELAYNGEHRLDWQEVFAGERAYKETGEYLPEATLAALRKASAAMKGPLGTPVGGGFRSLNVALRQTLDLYACIRPIRYFQGLETPVKHPERVDMVVFRENTEDVYAGIEYPSGSGEAQRLTEYLRDHLGVILPPESGIGIKPISPRGSKRLVRRAIRFALDQKRRNVTLVHKGNIMKYTEGAFRAWGYELAREEFGDSTCVEADAASGKLVVKDRIADAMFQEALLRPEQYDVIATTNLNGDYLSDALAAQVGGLGLAPGVNMSDTLAFFEPTHGTAPSIAGQDRANPGSLMLCGVMLLDHLGLPKAARRLDAAVGQALNQKTVTEDLASQMPGATTVGCKAFGETVLRFIEQG